MSKETSERDINYKEFEYFVSEFPATESFKEITVIISFTFGKGNSESHSGYSRRIINNDQDKMEAESFLEAAQKAWSKYYNSSIEGRKRFVKESLENKWVELKGEELTSKKLELM